MFAGAPPCVAAVVYVRLPFFTKKAKQTGVTWSRFDELMTLMLQFKTSCCWGLILFDANASLCIIQWVFFTLGFFFSNECNKPFYGAGHRSSSIGAYAATTRPVQTFLREESIYDVKSIFSGSSPLHAFAEQYVCAQLCHQHRGISQNQPAVYFHLRRLTRLIVIQMSL